LHFGGLILLKVDKESSAAIGFERRKVSVVLVFSAQKKDL